MLIFKAPLHSLRKTKVFRIFLKSNLNKRKLFNIGFDHKVALRPLTHASILLGKKHLEPQIRNLVIKTCSRLSQLNDINCFFDVGANVGLYTWEVAKVCPKFKIISFEPDPENVELLKMTRDFSNLNNIKICPFALSTKSKKMSFQQDPLTSATGCISSDTKPWIEQYLNGYTIEITVQTKSIDEIIEENNIPTFMKIDVEGHENEVLEGGAKTIKKYKPVMIIESFPPKQNKLIQTLGNIGYEFYDADRLSEVENKTCNFFGYHADGPLGKLNIQEFFNS